MTALGNTGYIRTVKDWKEVVSVLEKHQPERGNEDAVPEAKLKAFTLKLLAATHAYSAVFLGQQKELAIWDYFCMAKLVALALEAAEQFTQSIPLQMEVSNVIVFEG